MAQVPFVRGIFVLQATGSTNDDVRRLASSGAPEGTVVIAETQVAGRGRLGRTWDSPERLGLYLSLLLRPTDSKDRIGRYALAAAVAVAEACRVVAGERVLLKWPNDVVAGGRKLSGILAELRQGASGAELVVGVGINVDHVAEDFPAELKSTATSLRILGDGASPGRENVAVEVLRALAATLTRLRADGWPDVAERFLRYAPDANGRRVRLASGVVGVTDGLHATGALRVKTADGIVLAHASESVAPFEE